MREYTNQDTRHFPKLIHQTWQCDKVPSKFHNAMDSWKFLNPDYEVILWTEEMRKEFIISKLGVIPQSTISNSLNIPLPAGTNSEEYLNAYENVIKKLVEFKPQFIMFSAGFDAHKDDPLAQFLLTSKDFYEITKRTLLATNKFTNGNIVSILEGGYDLRALQESTYHHVKALQECS